MTIVFALINTLILSYFLIRLKNFRLKGLSSWGGLGLFSYALPLWIITYIFVQHSYEIIYTWEYFLYLFGFFLTVVGANVGLLFVMKFQALSELNIYKLGFSTVIGFLIDIFLFNISLSYFIVIEVIFFFISGALLSYSKRKNTINSYKSITIIFLISLTAILQYMFYKFGLSMQPNPFIHALLSQITIYILYLFIAYKHIRNDYDMGIFEMKDIVIFSLGIYIFTILEAYIVQDFPISVLVLLTVLNLLIYVIYDVKRKEFHISLRIWIAAVLSCIALVLVNF